MKEKARKNGVDVGCISVPLTAGRLSLKFEQGRLTDFYYGDTCVLKEMYFALRDRDWGTVPFVITEGFVEKRERGFKIVFKAEHVQDGIVFSWDGSIKGGEDSTVRYSFEGIAGSEFERNRLGFCVLHPDSYAGKRCVVTHGDGAVQEGAFPELIAAHQPFLDIREIASFPAEGSVLRVAFDGEIFEMEDQRNWTDASFKTYCTPLKQQFPVTVYEGDTVCQSVTVSLRIVAENSDFSKAGTVRNQEDKNQLKPHIISPPVVCAVQFPSIGCCIEGNLSEEQKRLTEIMSPAHLRYDYFFGTEEKDKIKSMDEIENIVKIDNIVEAESISGWLRKTDIKLVLAIHFPDGKEKRLKEAAALAGRLKGLVDSIVVCGMGNKLPDRDLVARLKADPVFEGIAIGSGTDAFFTQLNRRRPDATTWDFVSYSNNPQVHAFDDQSVMETIRGQRWNILSCKALYRKPICVTPITMKMRWNPDAAEPGPEGGKLFSEEADVRQTSAFLAAWTLKSLCMMVQEGISLVTYYSLTGKRGVMGQAPDGADVNPVIYPVYAVLAFAGHFKHEHCSSRWGESFAELYAEKDKKIYGLIGNCTKETQTLVFKQGGKYLRTCCGEETWLTINTGSEIILPAYSVICVDFSE